MTGLGFGQGGLLTSCRKSECREIPHSYRDVKSSSSTKENITILENLTVPRLVQKYLILPEKLTVPQLLKK